MSAKQQQDAIFDEAYETLAGEDANPPNDGCPRLHLFVVGQQDRIRAKWIECGRPADVRAFIREHENVHATGDEN